MATDDLRFFVLLARLRSISGAARELGISTSATSRRLTRLEDRLGVRLMNRTTRRVSLTAEGEAYFAAAVRIIGDIDSIEASLASTQETPSGLLRINATLGFSRSHLAPHISSFQEQYPDVEVQLVLSDAPMNLVSHGFDLGIRFGPPPDSRLVIRPLLRNRRFLCASPDYLKKHGKPVNLADLQHHNCIVLRQDLDAYDIWRFDDVHGDTPTIRVQGTLSTNDGETALAWVVRGHGIMLRSEWDIAEQVRAGELTILLPDYFQTANISAVYPDRHNLSAKVRVFIDSLHSRLTQPESRKLQLSAVDISP